MIMRRELIERQHSRRREIDEPVVREASGKDDVVVLREEVKKKREYLKTTKFVEPAASESSGKESVSRRRKRQGAKLPIPNKESRVPRDQGSHGDNGSKVSLRMQIPANYPEFQMLTCFNLFRFH